MRWSCWASLLLKAYLRRRRRTVKLRTPRVETVSYSHLLKLISLHRLPAAVLAEWSRTHHFLVAIDDSPGGRLIAGHAAFQFSADGSARLRIHGTCRNRGWGS